MALAFPLALRFDNVNLTGLAVIARFIQFIIVPIALIALARDRTGDHPAVKRNPFTDKVLPVAAVAISVALAVSFDYRTIFLTAAGRRQLLLDRLDRGHVRRRAGGRLRALLPDARNGCGQSH